MFNLKQSLMNLIGRRSNSLSLALPGGFIDDIEDCDDDSSFASSSSNSMWCSSGGCYGECSGSCSGTCSRSCSGTSTFTR